MHGRGLPLQVLLEQVFKLEATFYSAWIDDIIELKLSNLFMV